MKLLHQFYILHQYQILLFFEVFTVLSLLFLGIFSLSLGQIFARCLKKKLNTSVLRALSINAISFFFFNIQHKSRLSFLHQFWVHQIHAHFS